VISRERVVAALYHEEPDEVPLFDFLYNEISIRKILGKPPESPITLEDYMKAQKALSFDLVYIGLDAPVDYSPKKIENFYVDEWGMKYKVDVDGMSWYVDGTIKSVEDLESFQPPDPHAPGRTRTLRKVLREYGGELAIAPSVAGPFNLSWLMTGFDVFAKALYREKSFIARLLDLVTDINIELGKIAIDEGAEFIWIADDMGDVHGPFVTVRQFREFILPRFRRQVEAFKKRGVFVLLHCDGNVMPIMDDLVGAGIDAFHPCERKSGMNLAVLKEKYGDKITLIGNVEASKLIPFGSYEEIDAQIRECFKIAAPGGGYIFASDHSIHPGIPPEKARFLFEQAKKYRKYPIR
jgi:uroporphyrinogen decarboxylase